MSESRKRKEGSDSGRNGGTGKRSKGGPRGKWQTSHQREKAAATGQRGGGKIEPGDMGIWVTCVRGKEGAATEELKGFFEEYAESLYGITPADFGAAEQAEEVDIESSIQKEIQSITGKQGNSRLFTSVHLDLSCVLFFRTRPPIIPVDFVQRISEDARSSESKKRVRFVNRLTPVTMIAKATETGLEDVGKRVLREHFQLADDESYVDQETEEKNCSYAIRPTIRNHNTLERGAVINLVASLIGPNHRVDLTKPDKVIIVEIYQTICGMSVVGADWENLKRYNLAEIYQQRLKTSADSCGRKEAKANQEEY